MNQYSTRAWVTLILLSLVWGCSFFLMKNGLETYSWDEVAAMRITVSFLATIPILIFHFKKIKRNEIPFYFMTGFFGSGLPAFCFTFAQTHIESGIAGVLNSMTPVFTFALGVWFFGVQFQKYKMIGLMVAFAGAIILVSSDGEGKGENEFLYALPIMVATISYATSANIVKRYLQNAHPLIMGAMGFAFIGIPASIYLISTGFWNKSDMPYFVSSTSSIVILSVFGTVIASIVFYWLIQKTDSLFGSLVTYLIPIVAVILGVWDGEIISSKHIGGMALILAGIYVINSKNPWRRLSQKAPH